MLSDSQKLQIRVYRRPVDEVVRFLVNLLDEAAADLEPLITSRVDQLGRVTKSAALMLKAYILVTAASPLYNGNMDYQHVQNNTGDQLFNPTYSVQKWIVAAQAAKQAIQVFENAGGALYTFDNNSGPNKNISAATETELNIRNSLTERWNQEVIWANSNSRINRFSNMNFFPRLSAQVNSSYTDGAVNASLNLALDFYTKHGVPLDEDPTWHFQERFALQRNIGNPYIIEGYQTVKLHYDREPRFYATLGFDGSYWYGQGRYDDTQKWEVYAKAGQLASRQSATYYSTTGYFPKKLVHYETVVLNTGVEPREYAWPELRLSDLYLLYAEAISM